jgi:hypothetical protein
MALPLIPLRDPIFWSRHRQTSEEGRGAGRSRGQRREEGGKRGGGGMII